MDNRQIIKTYLEFKKSKVHEGEASEEKEYKNIEGIMQGVQSYFDRALSSILLYRMERRQYQELRQNQSEEVPLSQIYGAEHLIRLFGACCHGFIVAEWEGGLMRANALLPRQ